MCLYCLVLMMMTIEMNIIVVDNVNKKTFTDGASHDTILIQSTTSLPDFASTEPHGLSDIKNINIKARKIIDQINMGYHNG